MGRTHEDDSQPTSQYYKEVPLDYIRQYYERLIETIKLSEELNDVHFQPYISKLKGRIEDIKNILQEYVRVTEFISEYEIEYPHKDLAECLKNLDK